MCKFSVYLVGGFVHVYLVCTANYRKFWDTLFFITLDHILKVSVWMIRRIKCNSDNFRENILVETCEKNSHLVPQLYQGTCRVHEYTVPLNSKVDIQNSN